MILDNHGRADKIKRDISACGVFGIEARVAARDAHFTEIDGRSGIRT
jgi:hypothetical protein